MEVVSRTHLFHYALGSQSDLDAIVREGLRPLSELPESERWRAIEADSPGFFERVYALVAEPVLGKPYANSGIFLTPLDFRALPGSLLHARARLKIPLDRVDASQAVLTWEVEERLSLPLGPKTLARAAAEWDAERVLAWFGRDPTKLFFHVPQVAAYGDRIEVRPEGRGVGLAPARAATTLRGWAGGDEGGRCCSWPRSRSRPPPPPPRRAPSAMPL